MTERDVDMLSRAYEVFGSGDTEAALALIHPGFVLRVHTERPDIGSDVYHGRDGFLANFSEFTDVFDDLRVDPTAMEQQGEQILVACRVTGRGKASGVAIDQRIFHVWTIRDRMATRLEIFSDAEQARAMFAG